MRCFHAIASLSRMKCFSTICLYSVGWFLSVDSAAGSGMNRELRPEQTIVVDAKLLRPTINRGDNFIYWLNQSDGKLQRASLAKKQIDPLSSIVGTTAQDFCLSPDGHTAYVIDAPNGYSRYRYSGGKGTIQVVDLPTMAVTKSIPVAFDPYSVVCDNDGNLYVSDGSGQHGNLRQVDARAGLVAWSSKFDVYEKSTLRLTGDGRHLYFADDSAMYGVPVSSQLKNLSRANDRSRRNAQFSGGIFELTPDDKYAINRDGNVVQLGEDSGDDMSYVTSLEGNLAVACDPASSRLWLLASKDGGLVTYAYPEFKAMKTEYFAHAGESFAYDTVRERLWVMRWKEKCDVGGIDVYAVGKPTGVSDYPIRTEVGGDNGGYSPGGDLVVRILLGTSALMFFATIFWRWLSWPLPSSILALGWIAWIQAWVLFALLWQEQQWTDFEAGFSSRFMALLGTATGGLAWGILRGNKPCYVGYTLLLVVGLGSNLLHSRALTLTGIGLLVAVLYCGRKHWSEFA